MRYCTKILITVLLMALYACGTENKPEAPPPAPPVKPYPEAALAEAEKFCDRSGNKAYMGRDGCFDGLSRLKQDISPLSFASKGECVDYLDTLAANQNQLIFEHYQWCTENYQNVHDRIGCRSVAEIFYSSLTPAEFCWNSPPAPAATAAPEPEPRYNPDYREPGQTFDQPRVGRAPKAFTQAKPAAKAVTHAPVVQKKPATAVKSTPEATPPVTGTVKVTPQPPVEKSSAVQKIEPVAPVITTAPAMPSRNKVSQPIVPPPVAPSVQFPQGQQNSAPIGAVPAGVLATDGGQVQASMPSATPPEFIPAAPKGNEAEKQRQPYDQLSAPVIGTTVTVESLPPVPPIGQVVPPVMPGVPPDTSVTAATLPPATPVQPPAPTQPPTSTQAFGNPDDSFGGVIPNYLPPPPPNAAEAFPDALPLGGMPAGQAGR